MQICRSAVRARNFTAVRPARSLAVVPRAMADKFVAESKINFTLDASANGCTGMYWRSKPDMNASVSAADWPRNGAKLQGCKSEEHPGWVRVDHANAYWLPISQSGKPVVHFDK